MARQEGKRKQGRRQLGGAFARASTALGQLKDAIVRGSQIGKIKLDASALRRERDLLLQQLGARYFDRVESGVVPAPDDEGIAPLLERIREVDEGLLQQDAELAAVEAEAQLEREAARAASRAALEVKEALGDDKYERADDPAPPPAEAQEVKKAEA